MRFFSHIQTTVFPPSILQLSQIHSFTVSSLEKCRLLREYSQTRQDMLRQDKSFHIRAGKGNIIGGRE